MKKEIIFILSLLFPFYLCGTNSLLVSKSGVNTEKWVKQHFAKGVIPPFSFICDGIESDKFISNWKFQSEKQEDTAEKTIWQFTYTEPSDKLSVCCEVVSFKDFPAVEWVLHFSNPSNVNSPIIEKAKAINHTFKTGKENFILHHSRGSSAERRDFEPMDLPMNVGDSYYMTPSHGRSSDGTAFPFFNMEVAGKGGAIVAVGWTGKWFADIVRTTNQEIALSSGMEKMRLTLYPNEKIRTPKICLLFWDGDDYMTGHNQFRRFVLKHHTRLVDGEFAEYPLCNSFDYGDPHPCGEYECLTEEYAVGLVERYKYFDLVPDAFWLDAGWYSGCGWEKAEGMWWQNVGNMTVEKDRFPNGLRPIADAVHKAGAKFMVWFEPERVRPNTQIDKEHPEFLIKIPGDDNYLFNLGDSKALNWLIDYMIEFLDTQGIDYYRQDFNFDPYPFWTANDTPDRVGISEIKHIEGLYAFWDALLNRFPNLLIDNCASGGRRIDLETISRSAPLWRTDYQYGEIVGYQCHTYGLNMYVPLHGTGCYSTNDYDFRSCLSSAMILNWEMTGKNSQSILELQKKMAEYRSLRPYFYGDYYPLTSSEDYTKDYVWLAYQLDRPEHNDGIILAFRRHQNGDKTIQIRMSGIKDDTTYELFYEDYGIKEIKKGKELKEGFNISIPKAPGSLLIRYNVVP